jgi:hypothetical protein
MVAAESHRPGATWAVLQYVWGLASLGCEVHLVEELPAPVRADEPPVDDEPLAASRRAAWFRSVTAEPLPVASATLVDVAAGETVGLAPDELLRTLSRCELLINLAGVLRSRLLLERPLRRVYVDLDPLFTQVWAQQGFHAGIDAHEVCVTVGLNVGRDGCPVPLLGREWIHTVPPVALWQWPAQAPMPDAPWSTVGHWRSYGPVVLGGVAYGQKAHSFRAVKELPELTDQVMAPALEIHPGDDEDLRLLERHGWKVQDPAQVRELDHYRDVIAASAGEIAIAKHGYVAARTGWFSDRSVCYLATGRPVVMLDTGLAGHLPLGDGLLVAEDAEGLAEAVDACAADPLGHGAAARSLAERVFSADRVCARLLEQL